MDYKPTISQKIQFYLSSYLLAYFGLFFFIWKIKILSSFIFNFGNKVWHFPNTGIMATGSGDTYFMYSYLSILAIILILSFITIQIIRPKIHYQKATIILQTILRYYLIIVLFNYGVSKIFIQQFPPNSYSRLEEKIGDMTPMGLVWTFMGASGPYTCLSGLLEAIAAILLLFRKTVITGAILTIIVMSNIVFLNYLYDVPVKINSTLYLLIAILIFGINIKPTFNFLILQRPAQLLQPYIIVTKKWQKTVRYILKIGVIALLLFSFISDLFIQKNTDKTQLDGSYYVLKNYSSASNKDSLAPNINSLSKIIINKGKFGMIYLNDTTFDYRSINSNSKDSIIQITFQKKDLYKDSNNVDTMTVHFNLKRKDSLYIFTGKLGMDSLYLETRRRTFKDYHLTNTGFHWVNEYPNNQ